MIKLVTGELMNFCEYHSEGIQ